MLLGNHPVLIRLHLDHIALLASEIQDGIEAAAGAISAA
jgi:hypothetical protein